jgi:hypothetical protein
LLLALDGGAHALQGSFGYPLATQDAILLDCGGRAYGADPRSFRAEGYGMLTILRLVHPIRYFYVTGNSDIKFRLYCDSDSLIKRLQGSLALKRPAPQRYLFSEADIEMEILSAIHTLGTVDLEHVYGHQNESESIEPLSWEVTLNQHCDDIATEHLEEAIGSHPLVPFLPSSKVSLTVQGTTITHHIPAHLRTYAGLPALRDYKCWHHGWDPPVFDLIDWPTLHVCTQMLSFLKRLFTIKWTNGLLPFQEQQNQIDDQITLLCRDKKRLEIDLQGIIEHKVDTNKYHVRQAFHASTRNVFEHATVELGSSEYTSVTDYKPGGTAIIAQGNVTGRIHLHDSDKYGRR